LMDNELAVYSSHLPLDLHATLGNNAQLCAALGFKKTETCFDYKGQMIGLMARNKISRAELQIRLQDVLGGDVNCIPGGRVDCRKIGVLTGGGGGELPKAALAGIDTFITGEGPHWSFAVAEDLDLNVFYGGHYATETFGVKALGTHLAEQFELEFEFVDYPTGL
jgi:putative NIF3 family GTP cyclohydrolase 1 type 2